MRIITHRRAIWACPRSTHSIGRCSLGTQLIFAGRNAHFPLLGSQPSTRVGAWDSEIRQALLCRPRRSGGVWQPADGDLGGKLSAPSERCGSGAFTLECPNRSRRPLATTRQPRSSGRGVRRRTPRGARGCDWHSVHASLRRTAVSRRCARKDEVCVVDGGALGSVDRGRVVHAQMARLDVLGRESLPVTGVSMFEVELLFRAGKDGPAVAVAHPLRIVRSVREAAGVGPGRSRDISQQEISATARCRRRAARSFGHTIDNEELTRPSRTNPGERSSGDCDVLTGARPARTTVHPIVSATRSTPYSVRPGAPMSRGDRPDAFTRA